MPLGSRLKEYIDSQHLTVKAFERKNNFSNGSISRIVRENGNMNSKHLEIIGKNFPDLNIDWLIKGTGEMLISENEPSDKEINEKLEKDVKFYKKMVDTLQRAVDKLTDKN